VPDSSTLSSMTVSGKVQKFIIREPDIRIA
jgi:hypothetical protein